jgi:hypothetical protein
MAWPATSTTATSEASAGSWPGRRLVAAAVTDRLFGTLDWTNAQNSLNRRQAAVDRDDVLRAVVAPKDPGVQNWLDTTGYSTPAGTPRRGQPRCIRSDAQCPRAARNGRGLASTPRRWLTCTSPPHPNLNRNPPCSRCSSAVRRLLPGPRARSVRPSRCPVGADRAAGCGTAIEMATSGPGVAAVSLERPGGMCPVRRHWRRGRRRAAWPTRPPSSTWTRLRVPRFHP